jgi:hypothetical protein
MLIRELEDQRVINSTLTRSINANEQLLNQYEAILDEFKRNDIYIIIGIFDLNTTIKLYCQIYKKNMFGDNYQWIILGTSLQNLKNIYNNKTNCDCTYEELLVALNGTLQTRNVQYSYEYYKKTSFIKNRHNQLKLPSRHDSLMKNLTDSYMEHYFMECSPNNTLCNQSTCYHAYAFDLLLTIFNLIGSLIENKKFLCDYGHFERDASWFQLINEAFNNISFTGVTVSLLIL